MSSIPNVGIDADDDTIRWTLAQPTGLERGERSRQARAFIGYDCRLTFIKQEYAEPVEVRVIGVGLNAVNNYRTDMLVCEQIDGWDAHDLGKLRLYPLRTLRSIQTLKGN